MGAVLAFTTVSLSFALLSGAKKISEEEVVEWANGKAGAAAGFKLSGYKPQGVRLWAFFFFFLSLSSVSLSLFRSLHAAEFRLSGYKPHVHSRPIPLPFPLPLPLPLPRSLPPPPLSPAYPVQGARLHPAGGASSRHQVQGAGGRVQGPGSRVLGYEGLVVRVPVPLVHRAGAGP